MPDVFPTTMRTWIEHELDRGTEGRACLNDYLMRTYTDPLRVYYLGTNSRWLGEPEEVVAGFFLSRLERNGYLQKWQEDGRPLRRWLMTGFNFYLKELKRERRDQAPSPALVEEPVTFSGDPEATFDRASVVAFVHEAMLETETRCRREGLEEHWAVFLRHNVDGVSFAEIAVQFGIERKRAAVMSRTATRQFQSAMRNVMLRDGVPDEEIDREIATMLEVSGS